MATPQANSALELVARSEGTLLDPVYTAKAMAGLIDKIEAGEISESETVVFVHTGGTPASLPIRMSWSSPRSRASCHGVSGCSLAQTPLLVRPTHWRAGARRGLTLSRRTRRRRQ